MDFFKNNVELIIISTLLFMAFLSIAFSIERVYFLSRVKKEWYETIDDYEIALTKNLTALYIIYSNAPYVGLLGTVCGIMITFYDMGVAGGIDAKAVMIGMSLALKATAVGLIVAIPTLMFYNALNRKIDIMITKYQK